MLPGLRRMPDRRPMSTSGASRKATRKTRIRGRLRRRATVWSISARLTTRKADGSPGAQERREATQDRKSVVSGKSVSGCVDHGGRRSNKKKKKQEKERDKANKN